MTRVITIIVGCLGFGAIMATRELVTGALLRAAIAGAAGVWASAAVIGYSRLVRRK
jgi:hypothetical protein